jgi:1,4-alpha-glucan branching enzyme
VTEELHALARTVGVVPTYTDGLGEHRTTPPDVLVAILRARGVEIDHPDGATDALAARLAERDRAVLPPTLVAWDGSAPTLRLAQVAPKPGAWRSRPARPRVTVELEDGTEIAGFASHPRRDAPEPYRTLLLPGDLPLGRHELVVEADGVRSTATILSAPTYAHAGPFGAGAREWAAFLPLYAAWSARSWGVGDVRDLRTLSDWAARHGGRAVATLPLLAGFLDDPVEPSPYSPVSRRVWNELYIDLDGLASIDPALVTPEVQAHLEAVARAELPHLRALDHVDHLRVMAAKRTVLEAVAAALDDAPAGVRGRFERYLDAHPTVEAYARFRAAGEQRGREWHDWPRRMRAGTIHPSDVDPARRRYHAVVQWLMHEQLTGLARDLRARRRTLYLDLPLGSHPQGFDVWDEQALFAEGISAGAPPDAFFTRGQNWGFPPMRPDEGAATGWIHLRECLDHQLSVAGLLRVDHVMSLERLFWIPDGADATDGAYVHYPTDQLAALLVLASHRWGAAIVGEDLGTVSDEVHELMHRHHLAGMHVTQFQTTTDPRRPLRRPRPGSVASLGTHDLPPFAAWWSEQDLGDPVDEPAVELRRSRRHARIALRRLAARREAGGVVLPDPGLAPSALAPSALAPSALAPSALAPSALAPSGLAPSGLAPSGLAPSGLAPSALAPSGRAQPDAAEPGPTEPRAGDTMSPVPTSPDGAAAQHDQDQHDQDQRADGDATTPTTGLPFPPPSPPDRRVLDATLDELGRSDAALVVVDVEDLWLETEPQNVPGTASDERPNWTRRARHGLDELADLGPVNASADVLAQARAAAARPATTRGAPWLGEQDLHLFNEGSHLRLYEKLGAHPRVVDGVAGVQFAVWAPDADRVTVIGSFNRWDPERHHLAPAGESGIWAGFVPEAAPGDLYKYKVFSRFGGYQVEKADPFAFATEEPPRTASVVWRHAHTWADREWMATRHERNRGDAPISIYEVHLGSWRRVPEDGNRSLNYRELAPQLADHCLDLGFTHVELMPVMEHPLYRSWGYQITGFFAPTSRYGTPEDFMFLVDHLHQRGIGVILDWVPSHFPSDEHGLGFFDGTYLYEHADPRQRVQPDWGSLIFNYGRREVQSFLISNALFWLDRFHADGLRLDAVASMLYLDYSRREGEWVPNAHGGRENLDAVAFLRRLNTEVYAAFPDTITIAEESTSWPAVSRPVHDGGLGFGFKWDMGWMNDTLRYFHRDPAHRKFHHDELTFRSLYATTENFVLPLSHDEVVHGKRSLLGAMPGDNWQKFANLRLLLGYQYTLPGKPLLFMGAELGQWDEWDHDASLPWHLLQWAPHQGIARWVAHGNHLLRTLPALHERDLEPGGFAWVDADDREHSVYSWLRFDHHGGPALVVLNATPVPRPGRSFGVPRPGPWRVVANSDAVEFGGSGYPVAEVVDTHPRVARGQPHRVGLDLPPLSLLVLRPDAP